MSEESFVDKYPLASFLIGVSFILAFSSLGLFVMIGGSNYQSLINASHGHWECAEHTEEVFYIESSIDHCYGDLRLCMEGNCLPMEEANSTKAMKGEECYLSSAYRDNVCTKKIWVNDNQIRRNQQ